MMPVGWAVFNAQGGAALFLERPAADHFAVKVHGVVEPVYSGAQITALLDQLETMRAAHLRGVASQQGEWSFACSRH